MTAVTAARLGRIVGDAAVRPRAHVMATGFAMTVAMWAIAYVAMMGPGLVVGELLFALTVGCLLAGGFALGRWGGAGWKAGMLAGLVSAVLNLLIIGSLIGRDSTEATLIAAAQWGAGAFIVSMALGAIGAAVGARFPAATRRWNWYPFFTRTAAIAVFLLLITGGLVTGLEVGLAVPDWPDSFGHNMLLYPLGEMTSAEGFREGVFHEHAHRLYGMLVGVTATTLAVSLFVYDRRGWLRGLGVLALLMVIAQGVMGGLRVTETSVGLAIVHGVFGQVVFATVAAIAAFTSLAWCSDRKPEFAAGAETDRGFTLGVVLFLLLQLGLGAGYRHLNADPEASRTLVGQLLLGHMALAAVVAAIVIIAGGRLWAGYRHQAILRRLGQALIVIVALQVLLGIVALVAVTLRADEAAIPIWEVVVTSAHQATGALLLGTATLAAVWTRRLLEPAVE